MGELFCGPGGIALGAELANASLGEDAFTHSWAIDYHEDTCKTYLRNITGATSESVICADIRNFNTDLLPKVDGFAYGFPCNDFSMVGEHKGFSGEYGPLYTYGLPILNKHEPEFFIAENVGGLRSANSGGALAKILQDLEKAGSGYALTPHYYKFERYGIPQARHRFIIVGIKKSRNQIFRPPTTIGYKIKTSAEAITDPPIMQNATNHEVALHKEHIKERLTRIKPGHNAWDSNLPSNLKLNVKGARISQIYKRLDPEKPSYTITGSGGGGTHVYHWSEPRALTNREKARLQTFPDTFEFVGNKESVRRQIGMAVPPEAAKLIFIAIYRTLTGEPYDVCKSYRPYVSDKQQKLF
jgi:DNA (cytosine-5)-methyltransferase 1